MASSISAGFAVATSSKHTEILLLQDIQLGIEALANRLDGDQYVIFLLRGIMGLLISFATSLDYLMTCTTVLITMMYSQFTILNFARLSTL